MRLVGLLACLLTACGFTASGVGSDATPGSDAGEDAHDAAPDGDDGQVPSTCMQRWLDHTIHFATPQAITELNSASFERDPFVSPDETSFYFSSGRPISDSVAAGGGADIYLSTRASATSAWGTPALYASFSTPAYDGKFSLALNGSLAFGSNATAANEKIYTATGSAGVWTTLTTTHLAMVNVPAHDFDPYISADALRLYWAPKEDTGVQHISVAKRAAITDDFGAEAPIAELNAGPADGDPAVSDDQRIILFYSDRNVAGTSAGADDIWYATRDAVDETFTFVGIVPDINTTVNEGDPHLSSDGCHLYFARQTPNADRDLYLATATL